ncbi:MAG: hypothetical protein GX117_12735 [Candidatus Hydrogenedentes bacterium]|nr:hypothetical protein [Candidatus Hydrogenedentota bacterium]
MEMLLKAAGSDLWRHRFQGLPFLLSTLICRFLYRLSWSYTDFSSGSTYAPSLMELLLEFFNYLLVSVLYAAIYALFLAPLGAAVARPLWKYKGWRDGLARFFLPWLILNLLLVTLMNIEFRMQMEQQEEAIVLIQSLEIWSAVLFFPIGAGIMYWGELRWQELPMALRPLLRYFKYSCLALVIALFQHDIEVQCALISFDNTKLQLLFQTVLDIPLLITDLYIFILLWRIFMLNQQNPPSLDEEGIDF